MIGALLLLLAPADTLAAVQASYAKIDHLQAHFEQVFTNATFGSKDPSRGTVYLARPDKMRWDYTNAKGKPDKQMIYDGKTLWVVEPSNKQVYEHATQDPVLPAAIAFLNGGKLTETYDVTQPDESTLVLVPKQTTASVKQLTFVIDPKTKQVVRSIVVNHKDDVNAFDFSKVDTEKTIEAKFFTFSPKRVPLYKVIKE